MVSLFVIVIGGVHRFLPGQFFVSLSRELILICAISVLCVILLSVICKVWSSSRRAIGDESPLRTGRRTPARSGATAPREAIGQAVSTLNIQVKRVFTGDGSTIWSEFIRYFENVANLNQWPAQRMRSVLLTTLRGQAETYAYGLPENVLGDYQSLKNALNQRFGHTALKESYIAEAKLRRKRTNESFRDFGQAVEDLYRRAYPTNRETVGSNSLKTFLDNCSDNEDFRLSVKRTRPKNVQEAVTAAMQEECIRIGESEAYKPTKQVRRELYYVKNQYADRKPYFDVRRQQEVQGNGGRRKCFACGSESHLRNRCPKINSAPTARTGSSGSSRQGHFPPPRQ